MADQISKKLLLGDIVASEKLEQVPSSYIRPVYERPNLQDVVHDSIPVIDLHDLNDESCRAHVVSQIGEACREYGFFQVINHGVPESTVDNMMRSIKEFFKLPEEEKLKMYCDDFSKKTSGLFSSGYYKDTKKPSDWRDFMGLNCYPIEDYIHEWPTNPTSFRANAAEYIRSLRGLAFQLIEAISESLGLEKDYINKQSENLTQHLIFNYYPPCPQPDLTYGLPGHTDPYHVSILLQDEVPGLQVLKNDKWVAVDPVPNAFIINIGDMIQVISNDKYKSVLHRAIVNTEKARISIPSFYLPSYEAVMKPAPELVTNDEPAVYKEFKYEEYYDKYFKRNATIHKNSLNVFLAT